MATIIKCDHCGATTMHGDGWRKVEIHNPNATTGQENFGGYDICPDCMKQLRKFLKGGDLQ